MGDVSSFGKNNWVPLVKGFKTTTKYAEAVRLYMASERSWGNMEGEKLEVVPRLKFQSAEDLHDNKDSVSRV
ncbi:hypothetical protein L484_014061 [Morus notabilis]|uniref:Uncharacterized protein n=1 Tax=Morus notabilis TaxID=981085 RepID=W9QDK2_9ROSA|nr:hypothetical protein L484_014061 [Morus notabilis]